MQDDRQWVVVWKPVRREGEEVPGRPPKFVVVVAEHRTSLHQEVVEDIVGGE